MAKPKGVPEASAYEKCRKCCLQMVGGPRCYTHNPTPEQRAEREAMQVLEAASDA